MRQDTITTDQSGATITYDAKGEARCFAGPSAVNLYRAAVLRSAIGLMSKEIKPQRGASMSRYLVMVKDYTGKDYKRGQHDLAMADLAAWINATKATFKA